MPTSVLVLKNGQHWTISDVPGPPSDKQRWGACFISSARALPVSIGDLAAKAAVEGRCPSIAVAAPNAEAVHDYIDELLERQHGYDVRTTFHSGVDAIDDAITLLDAGLVEDGPVYVYSDSVHAIVEVLRQMGFIDDDDD